MTNVTRSLFSVWSLVMATSLLGAGAAWADTDERCTSMLCNLYNRMAPASLSKPGATPVAPTSPKGGSRDVSSTSGTAQKAKPQDVSGTPASNSTYWTDVQGGLLGGIAGTPERCTSSTCNLYYGDNPPEDPAAEAALAPPSVTESTPVETYDAPHAARRRGNVVADGERSSCEPSPQDPWRCYRR